MIGTKLAHYEITSHLGTGGMGEVYQATDSKLGRSVAIKLLPEAFTHDTERAARFEREARVLASLNHPNIAAIYGVEESGGRKFLVMELVSGETLAERIKRGSIPVDESLGIAKHICEALEEAHEKGVIHRDLKPSNIKVTPEGKVKVLDFGLAKAYAVDPANANMSNSPTLSMAATNAGMILGTAAYMSPEQAKGKAADWRADIWAFGVVLYEILTGRLTFPGETISETLAAVMMKDPDWSALPANIPVRLRDLLRRCLIKDPRSRAQSIGDVRIIIEELLSETGALAPEPQQRRSRFWMVATALSILAALGFASLWLVRPQETPQVVRFFISPPDKVVFDSAPGGIVSPDGRRIAVTAMDGDRKHLLWIRPLDSLTAQPLPGTDAASLPFWSPDSRSVAFFAGTSLKKIDAAGGPPQTLCDAPTGRGGTWNADGVIVFAPIANGPLYRVPSAGGRAVPVTKVTSSQNGHRYPSFLPDRTHFIYFAADRDPRAPDVFLGSLDSMDSIPLLTADSTALYSPPGYLLFVRQGNLMAQPFDPKGFHLNGEAIPIAEQIAAFQNGDVGASVSGNGTLIYRNGSTRSGSLSLAWFDRSGKRIESVGAPGGYVGIDVSRDGKRIAVHRHDGNGGDIWVADSTKAQMRRLTFDASQDNSSPVWSPDGARIAYASLRGGKWGLYQKLASGTGNEELLIESQLLKAPMSWQLDGKSIVYWQNDPNTQGDLWVLSLSGDRKPLPFLKEPGDQRLPQVSPDGKWIAYRSDEAGKPEIYVKPFPSGEGRWQISTNGGTTPRWRADGRELYYLTDTGSGKMIAVPVNANGSTFQWETPHELFDPGFSSPLHYSFMDYAVSPDGQRFLLPLPESKLTEQTPAPIAVFLNWAESLKRK